ncbi:hypothetical protein GKG47_10695 [Lactonifactor sp. BIOML-A3]|uniref:AlkZ-related protein n=1 Tax=unclassified Lactonifactor TaxID=2636670 RepID=UPI0012B15ED6|nr:MULTISPECIES: hypothetical protein [unclassified Lactonifactor]MSA02020.1 hypothetical protein [Lactonifactor sp. BIOML-A5]MSA08534.1 hypothetical protein [Lactonifactor sp. BIOML-A4]MSA12897.1 hypothetical protein [Lactonifactor sp. BIOML-A3]MSA17601.1 hypothetical protein [Lactonifactor sp. BIOML-A2]MSA37133.1 hypothetical protein [Lactonifactor sp. BIOML-A1]
MLQMVTSEQKLAELVQACGFVPLLKNQIHGFSVEEHTPPNLWFVDGVDGPWEWKGPVIRATGCAYGKFFCGKAGFISNEWFPDFANYRRDGYDFDARYDDGLARHQDKIVYDVLANHPSLLSKEWRKMCGIKKRGEFDSIVSRLQMLGYVTTENFEYARDRFGNPYGWGIARYTTPEALWGEEFTRRVYQRTPAESRERIAGRLAELLPTVEREKISKFMG